MVPEPHGSGLIHHTETTHEASGNNPLQSRAIHR